MLHCSLTPTRPAGMNERQIDDPSLPAQRRYRVDLAVRESFMKSLLAVLLFVPAVAGAQILVAGEGPVVYGHHHLNTTHMDAQKKFYGDGLGGNVGGIGSGRRKQGT